MQKLYAGAVLANNLVLGCLTWHPYSLLASDKNQAIAMAMKYAKVHYPPHLFTNHTCDFVEVTQSMIDQTRL